MGDEAFHLPGIDFNVQTLHPETGIYIQAVLCALCEINWQCQSLVEKQVKAMGGGGNNHQINTKIPI